MTDAEMELRIKHYEEALTNVRNEKDIIFAENMEFKQKLETATNNMMVLITNQNELKQHVESMQEHINSLIRENELLIRENSDLMAYKNFTQSAVKIMDIHLNKCEN